MLSYVLHKLVFVIRGNWLIMFSKHKNVRVISNVPSAALNPFCLQLVGLDWGAREILKAGT